MVAAYRRMAGNVMTAQLLTYPLHSGKKKGYLSPAQKAGLAYEKKAQIFLSLELPNVTIHPALKFISKGALHRFCIPDALAYNHDKSIVTIIEIKLTHNGNAWDQLQNLYKPVVRAIYPEAHINLVEVCRNYDPSIQLPGQSLMIDDLRSWIERPQRHYGIYFWSGR